MAAVAPLSWLLPVLSLAALTHITPVCYAPGDWEEEVKRTGKLESGHSDISPRKISEKCGTGRGLVGCTAVVVVPVNAPPTTTLHSRLRLGLTCEMGGTHGRTLHKALWRRSCEMYRKLIVFHADRQNLLGGCGAAKSISVSFL